jgi:FKBP-type peptidyl-prolyl cis-trans isomerase
MSVTAVPIRPIRKGSLVKLWLGLGALCLIAAGVAWAGSASQRATDPGTFFAENARRGNVRTTASGLQIEAVREGTGISPGPNDMVLVEYEGRLLDGTVFDASARHGGPAPFPVSGVIPGWTEALQLMKKGGSYRVWIPSDLAYGAEEKRDPQSGKVVIPANAPLDFDVTLIDVARQAPQAVSQPVAPATPEQPTGM